MTKLIIRGSRVLDFNYRSPRCAIAFLMYAAVQASLHHPKLQT